MKIKQLLIIIILSIMSYEIQAQPKVGIVLSGGGALGYAHVGVLQALEENGISPQIISGASMGALVGLFYASGMSPQEIYEMIKIKEFYKFTRIFSITGQRNKLGFSTHTHVEQLMDEYIPYNQFDSLQKKLYIAVTNLNTEACEYICSGNKMKEYALASSSIPIIFEAIVIDSQIYIDGGTINNFPAQPIRNECDILIGIDVMPHNPNIKIKNAKDIASRTLSTIMVVNSYEGKRQCDFVLESFANNEYTTFDYDKFQEIYKYGYQAMIQYIKDHPEIKERCSTNQRDK